MRYWWVNQNQTYEAETQGGYLWSPKRNANGVRNQFYENMREVSPGDLILSFRSTRISAIGVASSHAYESPKPAEFGSSGQNWASFGWKVDAVYKSLDIPIRPKEHIVSIRPLLPEKYSPLRTTGDGLQSVYLAELSPDLAGHLLDILREEGNGVDLEALQHLTVGHPVRREEEREVIDASVEKDIQNQAIEETEKEQLIKARRGQGRFRENVEKIETSCRVTRVSDSEFLIASHIKPWRSSDNRERLDGENGLLLTPSIDRLFDRGYISFSDSGQLIMSPVASRDTLASLGVPVECSLEVGGFTQGQKHYLAYHRRDILLKSGGGE